MELTADAIMEAWNELSGGRKCMVMTATRRKQLEARKKEKWWRENWLEALHEVNRKPFLMGENARGWKATIDWFLRPDSVAKVLEGVYDDCGGNGREPTISELLGDF